jgi:hypothetical protein
MMAGMALMVVGLLILVPSGLCTAAVGAMSIYESLTSSTGLNVVSEALVFGGPFILVGALLFLWGRSLRRSR